MEKENSSPPLEEFRSGSDNNFSVPIEKLSEGEVDSEIVLPMESESEKEFIARHTNVRAMIAECERLSANINQTIGHIFAIVQSSNGYNSGNPENHSEAKDIEFYNHIEFNNLFDVYMDLCAYIHPEKVEPFNQKYGFLGF